MRNLLLKFFRKFVPELSIDLVMEQMNIIKDQQAIIEDLRVALQRMNNSYTRLNPQNPMYVNALEATLKRQDLVLSQALSELVELRRIDITHIDKNINSLRLRISELEKQRNSQ